MTSRIVRAVTAVGLAAVTVFGVGTSASASASSGASTGDFTGDGVHDIMVRHQATGQLWVYPHSGTFNGTNTYRPASVINHGWTGLRWIGQGDLTGDNRADVVSVAPDGTMTLYPNSGSFNGTSTLAPSAVIGTGFETYNLIAIADANGDGLDDILARRTVKTDGNWIWNVRVNLGVNGLATLGAPAYYSSTAPEVIEQNFADINLDGTLDEVMLYTNGHLATRLGRTGFPVTLGTGWETISAITLTDVDADGKVDILGRRAADGALQVYVHSGTWAPESPIRAYNTFRVPVVVGYQWHIHDVIS